MNSSLLRCAAVAALIALAPSAYATVSEDAQVLMGQGQHAEALKTLEQHLAKNPQDAEARFMRGLVLVRLNRSNDAIKVFADLTRDYPQLPEPYNNLAVLYAQQGDYEKARDALEAALATHPSYATAHENLGDIYAALAAASYNRALMLDQNNATVRNKLALVGQVDRSGGSDPLTVTANAPRTAVPAAAAKPAAPPRAPAAKPAAPVTAAVAAPAAPAPVAAAPAAAPAEPAAPAAPIDEAAVLAAVNGWASAWSQQSLDAYFAAYADDYTPEGGITRSAWEGQRRDRIARPKRIKVTASKPQIARIDAERVRVTFTQEYESDSFSDQVSKVLELKQSGGAWKITREYTR